MQSRNLQQALDGLKQISTGLYGRDLLLTFEQQPADLLAVLHIAEILKGMHERHLDARLFHSGLAVSIFRDQSTRTRFSMASAASLLGLSLQEFDEKKSQVAHGETVRETANMIAFLTEAIGIRDDLFIGKGHTYMQEFGRALDDGFSHGVLVQRPALVNLQCDIDHPTQSMADLLHLKSVFGGLEQLKGKKLAMTWAYSPSYGKPLSVPQGIVTLLPRFGMDVVLAYPEGYDLLPEAIAAARRGAEEGGGKFEIVNSMEDAFESADIVYPKSWAPFSVMEARTKLFEQNDQKGLAELERQGLAHNARYTSWECDEAKMKRTRQGQALYMHCLPADISGVSCERGEVTAGVFEKYRLATYKEAGFKPFAIAAMIVAARFKDPAAVLERLLPAQELVST